MRNEPPRDGKMIPQNRWLCFLFSLDVSSPMFGPLDLWHWTRGLGRPSRARLARWRSQAKRIIARSQRLRHLTDDELLTRGRELQWKAKTDTPLRSLLIDTFALVREAARRAKGWQHYPVQLMGGMALFEGHVAEMQTGEGKTLTATLAATLRALPGRGCHVITVNDYLAERDADLMSAIYGRLGLSVGCIQTSMDTDARRAAYACDITYGTAKELGFDFLRDRLRKGNSGAEAPHGLHVFGDEANDSEPPVQREHYFALVDEADSVLIDEARTPLIIGLTLPNEPATVNLMRWSQRATHHLSPESDFIYKPDRRTAMLTEAGCRRLLLMSKPSLLDTIDAERIYSHVENALTARMAFVRDRDYVVVDDKVMIVDESTGRIMDGRKWQDGLHQAIEAKELVPITAGSGQAARITMQSYFRQYAHLSGMTGTASNARRELRRAYHLKVTAIPTNRPCIRRGRPPRIFATFAEKSAAVAGAIEKAIGQGRSVLVGTPSVDASESLGAVLTERGIRHQILNAKFHAEEAEIVSHAGEPGHVTIATNMAGRGTDIELDDAVRTNGGLHVIGTEIHSSARIDRQLVGRAARQGDPGSYQFFLSLDDELLRCLPEAQVARLRRQARPNRHGELPRRWMRLFLRTQNFLERTHRKQRKALLKQEKKRTETYRSMGLDPYLELTE